MPTLTVYKAKHLWYEWTCGGEDDALYTTTDSGWMEEAVFQNWFVNIFIPQTKPAEEDRHRLFICDGHNSHINFAVAKAAIENNIHILCLPPHTTHALQPLDVACFRSAKAIWSRVCNKYFQGNYKKPLGKEFPACLQVVSQHLADNPAFCVNGFRKCGIHPFDRTAGDDKVLVTGRKPTADDIQLTVREEERRHIEQFIAVVGDFLKQTFPVMKNVPTRQRKKVQCTYGENLNRVATSRTKIRGQKL